MHARLDTLLMDRQYQNAERTVSGRQKDQCAVMIGLFVTLSPEPVTRNIAVNLSVTFVKQPPFCVVHVFNSTAHS